MISSTAAAFVTESVVRIAREATDARERPRASARTRARAPVVGVVQSAHFDGGDFIDIDVVVVVVVVRKRPEASSRDATRYPSTEVDVHERGRLRTWATDSLSEWLNERACARDP